MISPRNNIASRCLLPGNKRLPQSAHCLDNDLIFVVGDGILGKRNTRICWLDHCLHDDGHTWHRYADFLDCNHERRTTYIEDGHELPRMRLLNSILSRGT